jgi:transcriptional regulator with XRE-family HTH domain
MTAPNNIAIARKSIGITQTEMARLLGLTRSMYAMIESQRRSMPPDALLQFNALMTRIPDSFKTEQETDEPTPDEKDRIDQELLGEYRYKLNKLETDWRRTQNRTTQKQRLADVLQQLDPDTIQNPERTKTWKELHQIGLTEPRDPAKDWKQTRIYQLERESLLYKLKQLEKG